MINAKDQLRQRLAFALSTLVVADLSSSKASESAITFYDIFVRNAFSNYFDVLREVAYSPAMGSYLTYVGNPSFAVSGSLPDENFSRELQVCTLMLVFSPVV